jgi:hypothetical protein
MDALSDIDVGAYQALMKAVAVSTPKIDVGAYQALMKAVAVSTPKIDVGLYQEAMRVVTNSIPKIDATTYREALAGGAWTDMIDSIDEVAAGIARVIGTGEAEDDPVESGSAIGADFTDDELAASMPLVLLAGLVCYSAPVMVALAMTDSRLAMEATVRVLEFAAALHERSAAFRGLVIMVGLTASLATIVNLIA